MFFLLRMAFWFGLVLVLLPRDKTPKRTSCRRSEPREAVSAATAAVSDMSQFCKRQPAACEVGGQAATVIGHRAQAGARKIYQIITDKKMPDHTGSIGGVENTLRRVAGHGAARHPDAGRSGTPNGTLPPSRRNSAATRAQDISLSRQRRNSLSIARFRSYITSLEND